MLVKYKNNPRKFIVECGIFEKPIRHTNVLSLIKTIKKELEEIDKKWVQKLYQNNLKYVY